MRRRRAGARLGVLAAVVLALVVGLLPVSAVAVPPDDDRLAVDLVDLPEEQLVEEDTSTALDGIEEAEIPTVLDYDPKAVTEPVSDTGAEAVTDLAPGDLEQVSDLPVEIGAPEGASPAAADALEGDWQVQVIDQTTLATDAYGSHDTVNGLAFTVTPPAGATGEAVISLDHTAFAEMYGAGWADRLSLTQFPACFLTTPDVEGCSEPVELDTETVVEPLTTDAAEDHTLDGERRITTTVDVASLADTTASTTASTAAATDEGSVDAAVYRPASAAGAVRETAASSDQAVFFANSKASGAQGDFSATPLASAGSWSAGGSSGAFTYSYSLNVPAVPGGPSPNLAFSYNSQSVDGRTSASNNQSSWIGDGWEYNAGSITRTYKSCRDDIENGNNKDRKTSDLCFGSYNATLTLGGTTTELVLPENAKSEGDSWVTANGDGSKVELIKDTGKDNGDKDGEYWKVTTRDGTQYYFGRHKLTDDWASGDPVTDSVLTVPVASNQSGEPCYAGSTKADFAKSFCDEAWRWNLDYVVDTQGNAMSLWWDKETNYYAKNLDFKNPVQYDRGGYLKTIKYGQLDGNAIYDTDPIAKVEFTVDERCFKDVSTGTTCVEDNFTSSQSYKNRIWYDTPVDLYCSGKDDEECFVPVPTFWSRKRLAEVATYAQRDASTTTPKLVDKWVLEQSLPVDRTDEGTALWLESVTRTGYGTDGTKKALPPVRFIANTTSMPNRVKEGSQDARSVFDRLRIERVVNEYGGETQVDYSDSGLCSSDGSFPKPEANTGLCFPAYWHPDPEKTDETISWFNKYRVESVTEAPNMVGVKAETTTYEYGSDATSAYDEGAWALNQAEFSKKKTRTYDQWRGYALVRTITGQTVAAVADTTLPSAHTATTQGMSETKYFRGMHDDPLPDGTKRSVTVTANGGTTIAKDLFAYQGRVAETLTYTKKGGSLQTRTVSVPTTPIVLATRVRGDGIPDLNAYRVNEASSYSRIPTSDSATPWRTTQTVNTYDSTYGLPLTVESQGDTSVTGDESCSVTSYVHNTTKHLIGLSKQTLTTAGFCSAAATATAADWISGSRVAYDNGAYGDTPTRGLATDTWNVSGEGGGWTKSASLTYDDYGRVTETTNAAGETDKTVYGPDKGQVYSVTTINMLEHSSTSYIEPGRGTALKEEDANGNVTRYAYDALGRTTDGWSSSQSTDDPASVTYTYNVDPSKQRTPSVVTSTLAEDGTHSDSVVLYDGLGRERQTQTPAVGGEGRLVTDVLYSENGTVWKTNNAYFAQGDPEPEKYDPLADSEVPNATLYSYDGLGRVLSETPYEKGVPRTSKKTYYAYGPDNSTVIEPSGGTSQRSWTDVHGRTSRVDTFTNAARTEYRSTTYKYDARGDQIEAKDNKGNLWTWTYDARGRVKKATDPDAGTTTTTYDVMDRPQSVTTGVGTDDAQTVWNVYDVLGRLDKQHQDTVAGKVLTDNEYDKSPGGLGMPTSTARYTDDLAYTTSVDGYTDEYLPTGKTVTLPLEIASAYGFQSEYSYTYDYTRTGQPKSVTLPAAGAFAEEKVITRYTADGLPLSTSGDQHYISEATYSVYGELLRSTNGEQGNRVWTTNFFDESSGALTRNVVDRESTSDTTAGTTTRVNDRYYGYDAAGNVLQTADVSNGVTDRQCFTYDALGQLSEAWTSPNSGCMASGKTTRAPTYDDGTVNVTSASNGYWHTYDYDELGNRKTLVKHDPGLDTAKDATTSYTYGKTDGTQPHTLTGMSSTYTNDAGAQITEAAQLTYDSEGNTETRTYGGDEQALEWTWDGKLAKVTGFGDSGEGPWQNASGKCLDLSSASTIAGTAMQIYACNGSKAQKLRIEPASSSDSTTGALKILGQCVVPKGGGTANNTAIVIAACDGSEAQRWTATSTGTLKHFTSGKCLDVPNANYTSGTDLQLYTCNGTNPQAWSPDNETQYIYGGDGERLISISDSERTLYLGDTTVARTTDGAASYTERYYAQPGAPTVMKHAQGTGSANLSAQVADQNGSAYINVALASGNAVKFSKTDPFGVERTENGNWRSHEGYVGGSDDESSGLVHLGAREYDPTTGRFLSPDPVLDLADPVQMNGYVYCENNPITYADPSGLMSAADGGGGGDSYGGPSASELDWARSQLGMSVGDIIRSVGWAALKQFVGWEDLVGCFSRGDLWSCGSLLWDAIPATAIFSRGKKIWNTIDRIMGAIDAWRKHKEKARKIIEAARKAAELKKKAEELKKKALKAAQLKAKAAKASITRAAKAATKKIGNAVQRKAKSTAQSTARRPAQQRARSGGGTSCPKLHSFLPGTKVLMADGTTKPIETVKNGDEIVTTDTETDKNKVKAVAATITSEDDKKFTVLTVATGKSDGDGDGQPKTSKLTATDHHPFWVPALKKWVEAGDLKPGQWLRTSAGTHVQISVVAHYTERQRTHDLTVTGIHAYYVLAEETPLLVHNCGGTESGAQELADRAEELQGQAGWSGTTAVVRVRNIADPSQVQTWVASNRTYLPTGWRKNNSLQPGEIFVQLEGHAEESILSALDGKWEVMEGGTSTGICWGRCTPLLNEAGITIGGPDYKSSKQNSSKRLFWKP
ncbi:ricin-type beta-trefoil lectin domain protein [Streptomyces fulvoviolaceus]|uniref:ricin-type beta-trefoil lectin domain protein n=1 Tax=Streptomyces fulvoviolaceus TaxID=285535 RepID=UPI0021BFB2C4|nr:ricin-type beta-trefoil lectin domain protein [Streptomyces fulvoviolaceus]MCT9078970.1 ricin-type beta-trefoil lectin domain protein [Streptomyces fulvoviolaceus]